MTLDEFLAALERAADRFKWMMIPDEGWHSERRSKVRFHLRATSLGGIGGAFGPVVALCRAQTGKLHARESWRNAAIDLGLSREDAERVTAAANHATWTGETGERKPDKDLEDLRARLIRAVGLSPPETEGD